MRRHQRAFKGKAPPVQSGGLAAGDTINHQHSDAHAHAHGTNNKSLNHRHFRHTRLILGLSQWVSSRKCGRARASMIMIIDVHSWQKSREFASRQHNNWPPTGQRLSFVSAAAQLSSAQLNSTRRSDNQVIYMPSSTEREFSIFEVCTGRSIGNTRCQLSCHPHLSACFRTLQPVCSNWRVGVATSLWHQTAAV